MSGLIHQNRDHAGSGSPADNRNVLINTRPMAAPTHIRILSVDDQNGGFAEL
jgi:hypothetical protein